MEEKNKKAGQAILDALAPISPGADYTLKANSSLAELNATKAIAVYIEIEFHDTVEGAKWIVENTEIIGESICKGICNYFGATYKLGSSECSRKLYRVQVGSFREKLNAESCLEKVKNTGFSDAFIVEEV